MKIFTAAVHQLLLGGEFVKRRLLAFLRLFHAHPVEYFDDCAHCWGSYPRDQVRPTDLPLVHDPEFRDEKGQLLGYLKCRTAQNIPLCIMCREEAPILFRVSIRPWGIEYLWQHAATGAVYKKKRTPEKLGSNILEVDEEGEKN